MKKKLLCFLIVLLICFLSACAVAEETGNPFRKWDETAESLKTLIRYVESVTDPQSADFIPEADRIAVFDMDGTLCSERNPIYLIIRLLARRILTDETYQPDAEVLAYGRMLRDHLLDQTLPYDLAMQYPLYEARAYAGMTLAEYKDFVTREIARDADGFEGMSYAEAFFLPMVEVVDYLQDHGFNCYICSGSDRFICRVYTEGMLDIPYENMIGTDVELKASNQGDADGSDYEFCDGDTLVRTDQLLVENEKSNKVFQIARHIGKQPVLSFGNSDGDVSMHNYTLCNNPYKSAAFMLIADDEVRDYGNAAAAADLRKMWEESGYTVISMANDWKTIYGEDVRKTGEFHWVEDLAEVVR